ncbi:hypothetical protein E4U54_006995 [Claviceps lovelessii]|nr:hypothetical protein E4U54_006995 [Claviceps lovelessii]
MRSAGAPFAHCQGGVLLPVATSRILEKYELVFGQSDGSDRGSPDMVSEKVVSGLALKQQA